MTGRREPRNVDVPAAEIQIEDRRGSGDTAPGSRGLVADHHHGDPDSCGDVVASLRDEYERYVEAEHAICPGCPGSRSTRRPSVAITSYGRKRNLVTKLEGLA